jgi:superfamily I DNA and/or RNA helicase
MVQRIKPVMLMSPISVAQFLPPGSVDFDLLVIDEASQIRPEDALGVVIRARQIVVVGDQKQLPPTSFFDRLVDDVEDIEDENEDAPIGATAADMESILSLCEVRGLRSRMLEWHYRSRDPSLIRVSNAEFYRDELVLPPSPLQLDEDYGLKFRRVPGVYARGGSGLGRQGTNRIEAQAVVQGIAEHARAWPDLSLGVVAFSKAQADMLTELLEMT